MPIKQKLMAGAVGVAVLGAAVMSAPVGAVVCGDGSIRAGDEVTNVADCNVVQTSEDNDILSLVELVSNILIAVLGIVTVGVIIYGGTRLVLSEGDPSKVKAGKSAIVAGVTGLVIALAAWAIVRLVLLSIN